MDNYNDNVLITPQNSNRWHLNDLILQAFNDWDEKVKGLTFWQKLKSLPKNFSTILFKYLDLFINAVEGIIPTGVDKKIAVMSAIENIYDYCIFNALPIYLKPFSPVLRMILIKVIANNLVDFIVSKYKDGAWKQDDGQIQVPTSPV